MPQRSRARVTLGFGSLAAAAWLTYDATQGPHGSPFGLLAAVGALIGTVPGAILGANRPRLRAPVMLALGAGAGGLLGLVAGAVWLVGGPVMPLVLGGLALAGGAVIIVLVAVGVALVALAPGPSP